MAAESHGHGGWRSLATFATLLLFGALLVQWTSSQMGSEMAALGERMWPGYGVDLRETPTRPAKPVLGGVPEDDADKAGDPEGAAAAPGDESAGAVEGEGEDGEEDEEDLGALVDLLADDVEGAKTSEELAAEKYEVALAAFAGEVEAYESAVARRTPMVRAYASVDIALRSLFIWLSAHFNQLFIILLGLGGLVATAGRHHISLRPIRGRLDDQLAQGGSLLANLLLIGSVVAQHQGRIAAGTGLEEGQALETGLWIGGFAAMALCNLVHLVRPLAPSTQDKEKLSHALLSIPLYAVMGLIAGAYFMLAEGYLAGLAVYLEKLLENVQIYLQVGLYVWVGMLLKRTRLASLAFAVIRPWRLPPELLAIVVVLLAAIPTAYSGASGIFVIAAGAMIFRELSAAGARPQLALASTAMSGSMGVVLSPCLLVVIISYISRIESAELFFWGSSVFLLSAVIFAGIVVLTRQAPLRPRPVDDAWRRSGLALRGLLPHVIIFAVVLLLSRVLLGAALDVNSAAFILPLALLPMLAYDRRRAKRERAEDPADAGLGDRAKEADEAGEVNVPTAFAATGEASVHVGALLLLMALSTGLGGVIERAEVVSLVPAMFDSPFLAMGVLSVVMVLIGMVMDPYGAVILVQATLSSVAIASGIDPIHFWMVVLVAFELGYLTPPVALNHLLARQVLGDSFPKELASGSSGASGAGADSLWRRHERYLLPITVMALTLIVVAFGPLLIGG